MSWWEVEHLTLPDLDWIIRKINSEQERIDKGSAQGNLEEVAKQFELVRRLRESGAMPPEPVMPATQKKRLDKMRRIRERHPLALQDDKSNKG